MLELDRLACSGVLAALLVTSASVRAQAAAVLPGPAISGIVFQDVKQSSPDAVARDAMFEVVVKYPQDSRFGVEDVGADRVQFAFFVDDSGLAVTGCGALVRCREIYARLPGINRADVRVLAMDPQKDLAVVRVTLAASNSGESSRRVAVKLTSSGERPLDAPCWTLYWERKSDPRAIPDTDLVEGVRSTDANGGPSPRRLLGAIPRNLLGGLPAIDAQGRLLGIWNHVWPGVSFDPTWTAATDVAALVNRARTAKSMSYDEVVGLLGTQPPRSRSFPRLEWRSGGTGNPCEEARAGAVKLSGFVHCSTCKGKGEKEVPGERRLRDPKSERLEQDPSTWIPCDNCKKEKLAPRDDFWAALRRMAVKLAAIDPARHIKGRDAVERELEAGIAKSAGLNLTYFYRQVLDGAKEELKPRNLIPGRAIPFIIPHESWPEHDTSGWEESVRVVTSTELGNLILRAPLGRNTVSEGYSVFVMATVAGSIDWHGREYVVLERPMAVPLNAPNAKPGR